MIRYEKEINKEVDNLIKSDKAWENINDYTYISGLIEKRLLKKGFNRNQIKELNIFIYGQFKREVKLISNNRKIKPLRSDKNVL